MLINEYGYHLHIINFSSPSKTLPVYLGNGLDAVEDQIISWFQAGRENFAIEFYLSETRLLRIDVLARSYKKPLVIHKGMSIATNLPLGISGGHITYASVLKDASRIIDMASKARALPEKLST
jgi:hypothetical protein